ncbi:hypothetical protein KC685_03730 [Candidatus Dojkabacteria bacterium]|uniref:Uncharacterized protein n=1 Tax=Candidatus Dojkabacteria bacterium TaxID=2099670 RepID=A0A955I5D1_9BACT|nr:hypothetical protein [Candidatus Dojkabacteria bacterium]
MKAQTRARITTPTQDHLDVLDIKDDLIISKNGTVSIVIKTNAVNFDLLSEQEQDNKIYAFAGMLNSLNFHLQILVMTERIDIGNYIEYLQAQAQRQMSDGLRHQLSIYTQFIQNLIVTNDVLDKNFYIVVPYNSGGAAVVGAKIRKNNNTQQLLSEEQKLRIIEQGRIFLLPKRDHILKQLGRMGLIGHQLTTTELIELFYSIYNPEED